MYVVDSVDYIEVIFFVVNGLVIGEGVCVVVFDIGIDYIYKVFGGEGIDEVYVVVIVDFVLVDWL